jgi:hypothetical protein
MKQSIPSSTSQSKSFLKWRFSFLFSDHFWTSKRSIPPSTFVVPFRVSLSTSRAYHRRSNHITCHHGHLSSDHISGSPFESTLQIAMIL